MPDTPFSNIEQWAHPTDEARMVSVADNDFRRLATELQLLRHYLQTVRIENVTSKDIDVVASVARKIS